MKIELDVSTLCEAFQQAAAADPDAVALRTTRGAVEITWREYAEQVERIARGLAALGVKRGDAVGLMLTNRPEFNVVDTAALHLGATPFSIYNTYPPEAIAHLFTNAGNQVVVCEQQFADRILDAAPSTPLEHVVCIDGAPDGTVALDEVVAAGDTDFDFEAAWRAVERDDVATLIYTSGTTGPPKGVEITHHNILACMRSGHEVLGFEPGERVISYLPSAHAADRFWSHYVSLAVGAQVTSIDNPADIAAALPNVRPTIFAAVPRIWEKSKAAIEAKIAGEPDEQRQQAAQAAIDIGLRKVRAEQASYRGEGDGPDGELLAQHAAMEELVFGPLRATIGLDQVRWVLAGAAPIAVETLEFFLAIGIPICELWGMSELLGGTVNPPNRIKLGTVGPAMPGVELKLADDGELLARSEFMMRGYRKEPDKTAEAIDTYGWMHTGDIAEVDDEGYYRIVDRKKELIINAAGKNMSPTNIENAIKGSCHLIAQAIAIGDNRPYNVALLTLDPDALRGRAAGDLEVLAEVEDGIRRANERLARVEQVKRYKVLADEWLPGGEEITMTMKLRRKPIADKYAKEIDELYEGSPA